MKKKSNQALSAFKSGFNCAQSVVTAFVDDLDLDKNTAMSLTSGFGGGMGKLQHTCGAATGSFMVFGLVNGRRFVDNADQKKTTQTMIQDFNEQFSKIHGSMNCKQLLGADLNTAEGQQYILENDIYQQVCEHCIVDAVQIASKIIE